MPKIKVNQRVRKKGNKEIYVVKKLFSSFVEIDKVDKNWAEKISNLTEYVDLEKLEELNEDTTGGCTGYS